MGVPILDLILIGAFFSCTEQDCSNFCHLFNRSDGRIGRFFNYL